LTSATIASAGNFRKVTDTRPPLIGRCISPPLLLGTTSGKTLALSIRKMTRLQEAQRAVYHSSRHLLK
jgi:hypothetical protein